MLWLCSPGASFVARRRPARRRRLHRRTERRVTRRRTGRLDAPRILVTGSADGLGRAAARDAARRRPRGRSCTPAAPSGWPPSRPLDRGAAAVVGDLADPEQTRAVADQVNRLGPVDAVIHNAGVDQRFRRPGGQRRRPVPAHRAHPPSAAAGLPQQRHAPRRTATSPTWTGADTAHGSYSDSKLLRHHARRSPSPASGPTCYSNAVDPGWVPTRMGGPGAPDDLRLGHLTQEWLATSDDPDALTSGGYWFHQRRRTTTPGGPRPAVPGRLLAALARLTGAELA